MLPTHAPHRSRGGRGNGLHITLVVVLSIALVGQFVYWRRQVSDLMVEVGGVHARMEKQDKAVRDELTEQKNSVQRIMEEKAALEKLNQFLQEKLNDCEAEKTAKVREVEDLRVKQGTFQAELDQLQRESKELGERTAVAEGETAGLKQKLENIGSTDSSLPGNVKPAPKVVEEPRLKAPVTSPVTNQVTGLVTVDGIAHGTTKTDGAAEGTAIQTGGVGEEYANETTAALAQAAGGGALGRVQQLNQNGESADEENEEAGGEGSLGAGDDGHKFGEWSQQEGPPKLIRPPDLIGKGAADSGAEEQAGDSLFLHTSKRVALQAGTA